MRANGLACALDAVSQRVPRHAVWGGEPADYNQEYIVSRDRLDAGLIADLRNAGVDLIPGRCEAAKSDDEQVSLNVRTDDGDSLTVHAQFFVEARGRAAPRTRDGGLRGPQTTALVRRMEPVAAPGTIVESLADGWAWYVCDGEQALLQVFVDSSHGLPKRRELAAFHDALCRQARGIAERSAAARPVGDVMSRNATTCLAGNLVTERSMRIGDAALAIDPLSGHGVFAAFGSALAASAAINTILARPGDCGIAMRFYTERCRHEAVRNARIGRDFYRLVERWRDRPFWAARRNWPDDEAAHGSPDAAEICIKPMPVVSNGFIEEHDVIVTPAHPRGVWRVDDVALAPLLKATRSVAGYRDAGFIATVANRMDVHPAQVATALNWLKTAGALE
jgi:flavin-dependent dehydrogenase